MEEAQSSGNSVLQINGQRITGIEVREQNGIILQFVSFISYSLSLL